MSNFSFWVFCAILIGFAFQAARGLYAGQVQGGAFLYERNKQPVEYWWSVLYFATGVVVFAWLLTTVTHQPAAGMPAISLFLVTLPSVFWLARGLQTGLTGFGKYGYDRENSPVAYWGTLAFYAAAAALALWVALRPASLRDTTGYARLVAPVVEAVRSELRMHGSLPFRNVGVDARSGLVCGEVMVEGRPVRFYGTPAQEGAKVVLEGQATDFASHHTKFCGGRKYVTS